MMWGLRRRRRQSALPGRHATWRECDDDADDQIGHRDEPAGCDRGIRGRMAELSQPGADTFAACSRSDRDAFAAGRFRPAILCGRRARRYCQLSVRNSGDRVDPRACVRGHRSRRRPFRKDMARTDRRASVGRTRGQAHLRTVPLDRRRRWRPRNRARRPLRARRSRSAGSRRGVAAQGRPALLQRDDRPASERNLRFGTRSQSGERCHRNSACADHARCYSAAGPRWQAVRHPHHQCRHAARARPRPVIGHGKAAMSMPSTDKATISFTPILRANSARSSERRPIGGPTSRTWHRRPEQRKALRIPRRIEPDSRAE